MEAVCKNIECQIKFSKKKANQIYCSDNCCQIVTNRRSMVKYHANKARLAGVERFCDCGTKLSRYNEDEVCNLCKARAKAEKRNELLAMINGTW